MRRQSRFISLGGSARKWIAAEEDESDRDDDAAAAVAAVRESDQPVRRASRPLARIGDIWSPRGIPFYPRAA